MAEHFEKFKRFEYRENSNLVLQREGPGPLQNEPTGEPESLAGRLTVAGMGDRVMYGKPEINGETERDLEEGRPARKKHRRIHEVLEKTGVVASSLDEDMDGGYVPTTEVNRGHWENLLGVIETNLTDQPRDVLRDASIEILTVLKTEGLSDKERLEECRRVLPHFKEDSFSQALQLSRLLTDFIAGGVENGDAGRRDDDDLEIAHGVAVIWDDEDGLLEKEAFLDDDEEEDEVAAAAAESNKDDLSRLTDTKLGGDFQEDESDKMVISVGDIGPHWLQRQLRDRNIVADEPGRLISVEKQILAQLADRDVASLENRLVSILEYEQFDFIQVLTTNHWRILYMTRLRQAQTEEERQEIRKQMAETKGGLGVLEELEAQQARRNREQDFARSVQKEAAALQLSESKSKDILEDESMEVSGHFGHKMVESQCVAMDNGDSESGGPPLPSKIIKLDEVGFAEDNYFIGVDEVKLGEGSERVSEADYDEINIPAPLNVVNEKTLVINDEILPDWGQQTFSSVGIKSLNVIQSKVFDYAYNTTDSSLLVCAPTGSGKTNIALLSILGLMKDYATKEGLVDLSQFKIIYVSPMKALVAEQVAAFQNRLTSTIRGLSGRQFGVGELTGDVGLSLREIEDMNLIVTTPEKWDVITRKSGERLYLQLVRLVIIDEIHLLHDCRGAVLESLISRMNRISELTRRKIRLVGLSATLPNFEDVGQFMQCPPRGIFVFGNHYRPVPLRQTFVGIRSKKALKRYNLLNEICYKKIMDYVADSQILVFVHSRRETLKTAEYIRDKCFDEGTLATFFHEGSVSMNILNKEKSNFSIKQIQELIPYGIGIHHAGLQRPDRKLIEDLFADGHLKILVSTSTLAWGVNLPAHTVIIKGTQLYLPGLGRWSELPPLDVVQMMGRAGRPQYDSSGHAFILTSHQQLQYYISLTNQQLPIESKLIKPLPDLLNAEIVLGNIRSRNDSFNWIKYTYLYQRIHKNPKLYGLEMSETSSVNQYLIDLIHSALTLLDQNRLINYEKRSGTINSTALGRASSYYYLKYGTMNIINKLLTPNIGDIDLFRLFSLVEEFNQIPIRPEEKMELSRLVERVPIPVKGQLNEPSTKINILLQVYISGLKLEKYSLQGDMLLIQQNGCRIMRGIFDISLRRGWCKSAYLSLLYSKVLDHKMWNIMSPLRQFNILNLQELKKIERIDIPWDQFYGLNVKQLTELLQSAPLANKVHALNYQLPKLHLNCSIQPITNNLIKFELKITPDFIWNPKHHQKHQLFWIFIENVDGDKLLHYDQLMITLDDVAESRTIEMEFLVPLDLSPNYFVRVISDRWIQSETLIPVHFKDLLLPASNPPPSELLNLKPLPIQTLNFPQAENTIFSNIEFLNPVQTQTFQSLSTNQDNLLICTPPSSGKTHIIEMTIVQSVKNILETAAKPPSGEPHSGRPPSILIFYVGPYPSIVESKAKIWANRLDKHLNLKIGLLTDEAGLGNLELVKNSMLENNLVLMTPQYLDLITRRFPSRMSNLNLIIVDNIQLMNDAQVGSVIEVSLSRLNYLSLKNKWTKLRTLAIGNSISDARDIGDWLGVGPKNFYNFHPNVRIVPLELTIHRFDTLDKQARMFSIYESMYHSLKKSNNQPTMIITTDRKYARQASLEILLHHKRDPIPLLGGVPNPTSSRSLQLNDSFKDRVVRECLGLGLAIIHEGMSEEEQNCLSELFEKRVVKLLVITHEISWKFSRLKAHMVMILDTEFWNLKHYNINTIVQFMTHAGRQEDLTNGSKIVIFCKTTKREEFKRLIFDSLPVESCLDLTITDNLLSEIVVGNIKNRQDSIDWITWTFFYRRLMKNPNFYGLKKNSPEFISDYLSDLIESACNYLVKANCIILNPDSDEIIPLNLGLISSFYYLTYKTVELFNTMISPTSNHWKLISIICHSNEIKEKLQIRSGEESALASMAGGEATDFMVTESESNSALSNLDYTKPEVKALILLIGHFKRVPMTLDHQNDLRILLPLAHRLIQALVDIISSNGWLDSTIAAIELTQMVVQASVPNQSPLIQLPFFTRDSIDIAARDFGINEIFDISSCEDEVREQLFQKLNLDPSQVENIAAVCNNFPLIDLNFRILNEETLDMPPPKEEETLDMPPPKKFVVDLQNPIRILIEIHRDLEEDHKSSAKILSPYYTSTKLEQWWILIGEVNSGRVACLRRISINTRQTSVKLELDSSIFTDNDDNSRVWPFKIYVLSDSYLGCDQEYPFLIQGPHKKIA